MISVRKATKDDVAAIQRLNHDLFVSDNEWNHDLNLNWPFEEDGENYFNGAITSNNYLSIVAEVDGQIVGSETEREIMVRSG